MKKYTHAWLAMMAMKRIEKAQIPDKQKDDAKALIKWFKDYRDFVISGSWYPDSVFKDMSSSHIVKYAEGSEGDNSYFRRMPETLGLYQMGLTSDKKDKPFRIEKGNLCDRVESFAESLIDSFKILDSEASGEPIVPSCNHIAMRFFILSHYIADCHMPLHCDARSFAKSNEVHGFIEEQWDKMVKASYLIDEDNNRFFYDPEGYPLRSDSVSPVIAAVEEELVKREFVWPWGQDCKNTWDYMSGISQYSYLMASRLVPEDRKPKDITTSYYRKTDAYLNHFDEYTTIILEDAVESIAKVWLHAWCRYRDWWRGCELARLRADARSLASELTATEKIIAEYPDKIAGLEEKVSVALEKCKEKDAALKTAKEAGRSTKTLESSLASAENSLAKARFKVEEAKQTLRYAEDSLADLKALSIAASLKVTRKAAEYDLPVEEEEDEE